jgi:maltose alpha-D-glucosyltransferase / alpha-amylase
LFNIISEMIAVRKGNAVFGRGDFKWALCSSKQVAAYFRSHLGERILVVNNLSASSQNVSVDIAGDSTSGLIDLLTSKQYPSSKEGNLNLKLEPYQYLWLKIEE